MRAPESRTGPTMASRRCLRVRRGTRYWLSFMASGKPWKASQSPKKSERIVRQTKIGVSSRSARWSKIETNSAASSRLASLFCSRQEQVGAVAVEGGPGVVEHGLHAAFVEVLGEVLDGFFRGQRAVAGAVVGLEQGFGEVAQRGFARFHRRHVPQVAVLHQEARLQVGNEPGAHQRRLAGSRTAYHREKLVGV